MEKLAQEQTSSILIKEEYISDLLNHVCEVTFVKKDNNLRVMKCSLNKDAVLKAGTPKHSTYNGPDYQVRVVDVEINQWRSFDIKSVQSFKILE